MSAEPIPLPATTRRIRWRKAWALDPHQPAPPDDVRNSALHLVEFDASDNHYRDRWRLGRAVADLPDDARLVGGYSTDAGFARRLRFVFASEADQ